MADYVKKIRTSSGDKQIDYNALANLPDLTKFFSAMIDEDGVLVLKAEKKENAEA